MSSLIARCALGNLQTTTVTVLPSEMFDRYWLPWILIDSRVGRVLRYYYWPVEKFDRIWNLKNCEIVIMEKHPDGHFKLMTPLTESPVVR